MDRRNLLMRDGIAIIGAGELGQAMSIILKEHTPVLWDIDSKKVPGQGELRDVVSSVRFVFLCIPSWAVRKAASEIKTYLRDEAVVVTLSKGLEEGTRLTMPEVLQDVLRNDQYALLSGPMLAEELADGLHGAAVVASYSAEAGKALEELFVPTELHVEYTEDVVGVAMAGVLKNVYAIGLGMVEGLKMGTNVCGWYVQMAAAEMAEVVERLGGNPQTVYGIAGLADFVATGLSSGSRNQQVGVEIAVHGERCLTSEGCASLPSVKTLLADHWSDFHVLPVIADAVEHPDKARSDFAALFA